MKKNLIALGLMFLTTAGVSLAQQNSAGTMNSNSTTMIGRESKAEFDRMNKKGAADVSAIRPTSAKLSSADQALMMDVAKGGMMQLEASKIAVQKASNEEVRQLAQAEVEEQTGLSAKLKEIAQAKGVTLPSAPDADTQRMLSQMQNMSGMELDRHYMQAHAVGGHELLDATMTKVKASASDSNLKAVAQVAHPLVKEHLKVSREVMNKMSGGSMNNR